MYRVLIFLFLFIFLFIGYGCKPENQVVFTTNNEIEEDTDYIVEIKGAVRLPGIYNVSSKSLIKDVIEISGGLLDNADINSVNLVCPISNNQMIYIPYKKTSTSSTSENKININLATKSELMKLSGIGEAKALAIIEYRNNKGLFLMIEDVMNVSGIGEELFNKIKKDITVS